MELYRLGGDDMPVCEGCDEKAAWGLDLKDYCLLLCDKCRAEIHEVTK